MVKIRIKRDIIKGNRVYVVQRMVWETIVLCDNESNAQDAANFINNPIIEVDENQDPDAATFEDLDNVSEDTTKHFGNFIGVSSGDIPFNKTETHIQEPPFTGWNRN